MSDPTGASKVTGYIWFNQEGKGKPVTYYGDVKGLTPGKHGFHTHTGNGNKAITACTDLSGHFNPDSKEHAGPKIDYKLRHRGAQGNILADAKGEATVWKTVDGVSLIFGEAENIVGRSIVVHAGEDDLGLGGAADSKTTGNAGGRVACCNI